MRSTMMEMFGGAFLMMLLAYSVIPLFPFVYVLLRWRQAREGAPPDPQLGLKVALHYFMTIGQHVLLIAVVLALYSFVLDIDYLASRMLRTAAGLGLGGIVVFGAHYVLIPRWTGAATGNVARVFTGLNVVLCGLVGTGALLAVSVLLFQEDTPEEGFKLALIVMLTYLGAWGVQAARLARLTAAA